MGMQWYYSYWETVIWICMLLSGPRLIPDIACCCRETVSVVRQLMAELMQAQHVSSFFPLRGENISIPDTLSVLGPVARVVTGL